MTELRSSVALLLATLLTASCATGVGLKVDTAKRLASPSPLPAASPEGRTLNRTESPQPAASPVVSPAPAGGLDLQRRGALTLAIQNAVAASRASKITSTLGAVSAVLSNNSATLISNNGGGLISNNGGGVIANNSGNLISNNGSGLTGKTKFALMDVAASSAAGATSATTVGAASGTPMSASGNLDQALLAAGGTTTDEFKPYHFTAETQGLVYMVDAPQPKSGGFKSYEHDAYHRLPVDQRETALVDDFSWDDVVTDQPYLGDPSHIAMAYHLKKNSSKRIPFADRLVSREILGMVPMGTGELTTITIGWEIEFGLDVAFVGGDHDHASFKATAGQKDLVDLPATDGSTLSLPTHLALTGTNDRGSYDGKIDGHDEVHIAITHTTPAGVKTQITIDTHLDGTGQETIAVPSSHLLVSLDLDGKGGGKGRLDDTTGTHAIKVGDVTWDAAGLATIAFPDGSSLKVNLF